MKKTFFQWIGLGLLFSFSFFQIKCSNCDCIDMLPGDLILGDWRKTADNWSPAYDISGNGQLVTDAYALYPACEKDNMYIFKTGNIGEENEGPVKCDFADPQSKPFTYLLKTNDTQLNISITEQGVTISFDFNILQLDATTLKLKTTTTENGVTYTNTQTFIRK
jgi:hypothetical protein